MMKSDEKGFIPIGGFSAQTVAIIAIVTSIFIAGYLGYIKIPGVTPAHGGGRVVVGVTYEDGSTEVIREGETIQFYRDPDTFTAYKTSSKNTKVSNVWFRFEVKVSGQNVSDDTASIDWSYTVDYPSVTGISDSTQSGSTSINLGSWYTIDDDYSYTDATVVLSAGYSMSGASSGTYTYNFNGSVTATADGESDSGSVSASIDFYWEESSLSITVEKTTGYNA